MYIHSHHNLKLTSEQASLQASEQAYKRASRRDNMKKKKWTSEENKLASMLAWVCCHADEDCPSEYRTKHFREHLKEAVDYLENSGWYDYNQQAGKQ